MSRKRKKPAPRAVVSSNYRTHQKPDTGKIAIKADRQQRKHVKKIQAAQARAARDIKTLGSYSKGNLAKTADKQLVNISKTIAKEWDKQKKQAISEAKQTPYHDVGLERPTKKDRMFAERPTITDAMIQAEPVPKRRKLMRQQQRKINDARRRINEWNKAQAMPKRSVLDQRLAEITGTTGDDYERAQIIPSKLTDFLQMTNVLSDEAFVRSQLESGHRKELINQIHDAAKILGLRTEARPSKKTMAKQRKGLYGEGDWPKYMSQGRYAAFEKAIAATVGSKRLKRFRAMTKAQKQAFIEQTDAAKVIWKWIESPTGRIRSVFGQDKQGYATARRKFERWMNEAEMMAD